MKVGDSVVVLTNNVCYAPVETVGVDGFIVEVLEGKRYRDKVSVRFLEPVGGYTSWLYDLRELIPNRAENTHFPLSSYK